MRLRVDDDVDILEPLTPGSDDPLPGFPRERFEGDGFGHEHHGLFVAPPRDPRARRLWFVAIALGVMSLLQFTGALYLRDLESDARDLEHAWRGVIAVDTDRQNAERALAESAVQYGPTPSLDRQRERLFEAASTRLEKVAGDIDRVRPRSGSLRSLQRAMASAVEARRSDLGDGSVGVGRENDLAAVTQRLDRTLRRWRLATNDNGDARLTTAREIVERLKRMTDEPTGLSLVAVASDGLYAIYPDANLVVRRPLDLTDRATVHALGDTIVVVDQGMATAYPTSSSSPSLWMGPADAGMSAGDDQTMWILAGTTLRRIDASNTELSTMTLPEGTQLLTADPEAGAIVRIPGHPVESTYGTGDLQVATIYRRRNGDGSFGVNRNFAAGLDNSGRVLIAPMSDQFEGNYFSRLRADVPRFFDLAVLP